jgi:mannose-1-phosphate guanylyltransferase
VQIIILSGGSGKRLWPLSNDIRSKQFIKILKNEETKKYESMIQRVYRQIVTSVPNAEITIATSKSQVSSIKNQLGNDVSICIEPCRKDTFPAIALASLYLKNVKKIDINEPIIVCPVDPYVDVSYFVLFNQLANIIKDSKSPNLSLMGIVPTYPSEKYGYIIPENSSYRSRVLCFKEKPTVEIAKEYINQGALWNGGVFAFSLNFIQQKIEQLTGYSNYRNLLENYNNLERISFDYAILEKEPSIDVVRYNDKWKDIGTWNTLTDVMDEKTFGNVVLSENSINTYVINTLEIPVVCMGLENLIITVSNDGILVTERHNSVKVKKYLENIDQQIMYIEKSWGTYTVLNSQKNSLTVKIIINAGEKLNYHMHKYRKESWNIISGEGEIIIDGIYQKTRIGDCISIPQNTYHTVRAKTNITIIEVQTGVIEESDKFIKTLD